MTAPWTDDRLGAAFDARARLDGPTPVDLTPRVLTALAAEAAAPAGSRWRRFAPVAVAAAIVLAVGGVLLAPRLLSDRLGQTTGVSFRPGPSGDLRTLVTDEFTLDFPASWFAGDTSATYPNMSSIAVLDSVPIDAACRTGSHVDAPCVNARPLADGETRVLVGTADYLQGTVLDRPNLDFGTTTRLTVDGYPALLDETVPSEADLNRAELTQHLYIGGPSGPSHVVTIDLLARADPPGDQAQLDIARSQMQAMIASFHYTTGSAPVPPSVAPPSASPIAALGLPIISVPDALTARASDGDRELAVRGWFSPYPPIPCPSQPTIVTLQPVCPDQFVRLLRDPETLFQDDSNGGTTGVEPKGPSFELELEGLDLQDLPNATGSRGAVPTEIVVIGHFGDRRARFCPPDEQQACKDRFVVDRVDQVAGVTEPTSLLDSAGGNHQTSLADALAFAKSQTDQTTQVLSVAVIGNDQIDQIEPGVHACPDGAFCALQPTAYWIVRMLDGGRLRTFGLFDGGPQGFELTAEGVEPITVPVPTPEVSPSASPGGPSTGQVRILTSAVADGSSVTIGVEDQDDLLTAARPASEAELAAATIGEVTLAAVPMGDSDLLIHWTGSVCDVSFRLAVAATDVAGLSMIDLYGQREPCDAVAIERGVVLSFSASVGSTATTDHRAIRSFPSEILGLPVVDIAEAQSVQAATDDDRELAIRAWYSESPGLMCAPPSELPVSILQPRCGSDVTWLLEQPEILVFADGPTARMAPPAGAAIHPSFGVGMVQWPNSSDPLALVPMPLVVVGHFDDPGARACPPKDARWCRDLFVIDRVAWLSGSAFSGFGGVDPDAVSTQSEIVAALRALVPAGQILGGGPVPGRALPQVGLGGDDWPASALESKRVWLMTLLDRDHVRRYLVADDSHLVWRIESDGSVTRLG